MRSRRMLAAFVVVLLGGVGVLAFLSTSRGPDYPSPETLAVMALEERTPAEKIPEQLALQVEQSEADGSSVWVLVEMRRQLNFGVTADARRGRGLQRDMEVYAVISRMDRRRAALESMRMLRRERDEVFGPFLEDLRARDLVHRVIPYTILNRVAVECEPEAVQLLAERSEVAYLLPQIGEIHLQDQGNPFSGRSTGLADIEKNPWSLEAMNVPEVRDMRIPGPDGGEVPVDGRGVVVGILDTGVDVEHPALKDGWRGGDHAWYEPWPKGEPSDRPHDTRDHGTSVLACAVGRPSGEYTVGVAPGAQWVAAVGIPDNITNNIIFLAALDWMVMRGQPDVLILAVSFGPEHADFDPRMEDMINAVRACEILPVVAAGNHGPEPGVNWPPANLGGLFPYDRDVLSVGAVNRDLEPTELSARGPSAVTGKPFPAVCAPGIELTTAQADAAGPNTLWVTKQGTSQAAGYVAGIAALLYQADPDLWVNDVEWILKSTARDLGSEGVDNATGRGLVDAAAAVRSLTDYVPVRVALEQRLGLPPSAPRRDTGFHVIED